MRAGVQGEGGVRGAGGEPVTLYSAAYACPHCGGVHLVAGVLSGLGMVIDGGPTRTG